MLRVLICIKCPKGCQLSVTIDKGEIDSISGNDCPLGKDYAQSEIKNPMRILTTTVKAEGLNLKMIPVRTNNDISLKRFKDAVLELEKITLTSSIEDGTVIINNILDLGVDIIATRKAHLEK